MYVDCTMGLGCIRRKTKAREYVRQGKEKSLFGHGFSFRT